MVQSRSTKIIAVVALVVAVIGLSIGYAAFATTLTISSAAHVSPGNNMDVVFQTTAGEENTTVAGVLAGPGAGTDSNFKADPLTINEQTATGIKAYFTEAGQSVTYTFKVTNKTENAAYLNSVVINPTPSSCTAETGTTQALVDKDCDNVTLSVKVGSTLFDASAQPKTTLTTSEPVVVTVTFAGADNADGDFSVAFDDIKLIYGTVSGYTG